jgi:hypothetical protein
VQSLLFDLISYSLPKSPGGASTSPRKSLLAPIGVTFSNVRDWVKKRKSRETLIREACLLPEI